MIPIILAGGRGERFWPLSRKHRPKQFLSLDGSGQSLLQATAERLLPLGEAWDRLWVVTAQLVASEVRAQLPQLPEKNLLVESQGRDTAPAVAWAVLEASRRYGLEAAMGFFPADHWIGDAAEFQRTLRAATELACEKAAIVTLGIKPSYPATGYGYIEQGERAGLFGELPAYCVRQFTEKPNRETAEEFLSSGRFSWNSGIFVFRAGVMLAELRAHSPEIVSSLEAKGAAAYDTLPKISIDYAVMEKTERAYVLPVAFGWDDLGDWNAIARLHQSENTNVELAQHIGLETKDSLFYATNPNDLIVTIGLEDTVVVRDGNVTLIVKKDRTQEIKKVLKTLQTDDRFQDLL